jgi:hypothetical protein
MGKIFPALAVFGFVAELIFIFGFTGCDTKKGEALVIEKEHIAAREILDTPKSEPTVSAPEATPDETERPMGADEISVGQYVMRQEDRGTSRDPRATSEEQWIARFE